LIWDPAWKMNPGKLIEANLLDDHLRLHAEQGSQPVRTHFRFPGDGGDFARVSLRCVGVGECRRTEGGTMCPSFMVTLEERHSTRGRARLLFEMLRGELITDGWKSEEVKEGLELCLSCKGCRTECPVQVDMATYKAEFLSHYYEGALRPRSAYAFGLIRRWARAATVWPEAANFVTQTPLLRDLAKIAAGMPRERRIPAFAASTFSSWFHGRPIVNQQSSRVLLWPDTFNDHLHPETLVCAVEVLEAAGFRVVIPRRPLCCGRPLYDYGFLDRAKIELRRVLDTLRAEIDGGMPVVGLEPSCVSVFRDELTNLFTDDNAGRRLAAQTHTFSEFLERHASGYRYPRLNRRALLHGHCHHKAVMGLAAELRLLERLGVETEAPDFGCCGMAGSFGFERDKYDVSMAIGELGLLPAVRRASDETLIVADGFSCREQIGQSTNRRALHIAEVARLAIQDAEPATSAARRDVAGATLEWNGSGRSRPWAAAALGAGAIAAAGWYLKHRARAAHVGGRT
jgi:Fe-S oxidoreductase